MICNIRNGPPDHLTKAEIKRIRKAVYKILVERCSEEEANAVFKRPSVLNFNDDLVRLITASTPKY